MKYSHQSQAVNGQSPWEDVARADGTTDHVKPPKAQLRQMDLSLLG